MNSDTQVTLHQGLADIDRLLNIGKDLKPEMKSKLKLVIDNKVSMLRHCSADPSESSPYCVLEKLVLLGKTLTCAGLDDDAVDDAVMDELEGMITKGGIGTPSTTEVFQSF